MKQTTNNYQQAIKVNLAHMGTERQEWAAVPVQGMTVQDGRSMPVYSLPEGYKPAPTLYRGTNDNLCCELCAHPIATGYYLQNDNKMWLLMVGSECVTHYQIDGKSGERLTKEETWRQNRQLLADMMRLQWQIKEKYSTVYTDGYGRKYRNWMGHRIEHEAYDQLVKITKGRVLSGQWPDSDATITKWAKKYGEICQSIRNTWEQRGDFRQGVPQS